MRIWISPEILTHWCVRSDGGLLLDDTAHRRSYQHLQRAEYLLTLNPQPNEHDRADCISNLRRCFTHRLKLIEEAYQFRAVLAASKKQHSLELLAQLGIVRPTLLQAFLTTRNAIEYSDAEPPDLARCQELVDVVWYFLRSTDSLLSLKKTNAHFSPPNDDPWDSTYWLSARIDYTSEFSIDISGWLTPNWVRFSEQPDWLAVCASDVGTKEEKLGKDPEVHGDKKDDDLWLVGQILPTFDQRKLLLRQVLNAF